MGWTTENGEEETKINIEDNKKKKDLTKTLLKAIIIFILIIIIILGVLIILVNKSTYGITVDNAIIKTISKEDLMFKVDEETYINVEKFANLVGYEFHNNEEYKSFVKEEGKCYVKGKDETTTFYLNQNTIYKLPINDITSNYQEFNVEDNVIEQDGNVYATIKTIEKAFNTKIEEKEESFNIYTLDYLIKFYDAKVKSWGFTGITDQTFENKKLLLQGYMIVKKEDGLYKIINLDNTDEIVSDKYIDIQFLEYTEEFFITNSLEKIGIIKLDGTIKLEPIYDLIDVWNPKDEEYIVKKEDKFGVVQSGDKIILPIEYDEIGVDLEKYPNETSKNYMLKELTPVCKNKKWGAINRDGKTIIQFEYDDLGCYIDTEEEIDLEEEDIKYSVLTIPTFNGIVVKKKDKYGIVDETGKLVIQIAVDSIYSKKDVNGEFNYYMFYNDKEIDIIETLKAAGLIKDEEETSNKEEKIENKIENQIENKIENQIEKNSIQ